MIPRRRIDLDWRDLLDLCTEFWRGEVARRADVAEFEARLAAFLAVPWLRTTASGRDALELILDGLGLGSGDQLIIPAYTLGELLPLLQARGLQLLAADIDPASGNVTVESIAARLTPQTRAILVAHLFGSPCDIEAICSLAARRGIAVIEDCAHAFGAEVGGRKLGSFGDAALFSFEVNKQVPAYGGGMLVTRNRELASFATARLEARPQRSWPAQRKALIKMIEELVIRSPLYALLARLLFGGGAAWFEGAYRRLHGQVRPERMAFSGFQARVGMRRLGSFAARNARRNAGWENLSARLPAGWQALSRNEYGEPVFYNLVAAINTPLEPMRRLALQRGVDLGIGSEVMDDVAALLGQQDCPGARQAFARMVLLPLHDGLTASRQQLLLQVLKELGR